MSLKKEISVLFIDSLGTNFPECRRNLHGSRNIDWIHYQGPMIDRLILKVLDGWFHDTLKEKIVVIGVGTNKLGRDMLTEIMDKLIQLRSIILAVNRDPRNPGT